MLDNNIASKNSALEIGPGNGAFLSGLSERFTQVTGIDNSAQMLEQAQANVSGSNIKLIEGDFNEHSASYDAIVANMVLHHLPAPGELFAYAERHLNEGGVFLFTDLCVHEQEWVSDACGDLWQGINEQDIVNWANKANLEISEKLISALKNGFQIQTWCLRKTSNAPSPLIAVKN